MDVDSHCYDGRSIILAGVDLVRPVALPSDQYCYISDSQSKGNVKSVHVLYIPYLQFGMMMNFSEIKD